MKRILYIILISFATFSCEDVIEVETPTEDPRLIVDAIIRIDVSEPITYPTVKVSETNSFFGQIPPVGLQQISLFNLEENNYTILLETEPNSGIYSHPDGVGTEWFMSGEMLLQIDFEDEYYLAYTTFVPSVPINSLTQGDNTLFDEDATEVIINYTDVGDREDYYVFDFGYSEFFASEDTFYDGQEFEFSNYYEDVNPGDEVNISILGASERLYDYMNQILEQSGASDFGAFQTPTVTVRGNLINATNIDNIDNYNNVELSDNFALGYFAIVQEYKASLIIE